MSRAERQPVSAQVLDAAIAWQLCLDCGAASALDRAAEGFRRNREVHGADAFGMFSCSRATNELNFIAQKFARAVMGSNNIDSCNRT